jgi:hypothetical protein
MPERWERDLRKLHGLEPREQIVRERVERGSSGSRRPSGRERVIAGVVAAIVFIAAAVFAREAFLVTPAERDHSAGEAGSIDMPTLTISAHAEPRQSSPPEALARYGDVAAVIPVQGGEGWGMGNAFPGAMFGPHEAAIPVGAPMLIESNADQVEVGFNRAYPEGDLIPQPIDTGRIATLPSEPGPLLIQLSATWPDGRAEFSVFVDLYEPVDVLDVDCRANRVPVWQSRVVRAQPDGIHATFQADVSRDVRLDAPGFTTDIVASLKPGDTSLQLPIPPGVATVGCNNAPDSQITVVDPGGFWAPAEVACPSGDGVVSVAAQETEERLIDEASIVERLLTVRGLDEVVPPGYPEAVRAQSLPSKIVVRRAGQIVAKLDVWLGRPARIEGTVCVSAGIRAKQDAPPAMPPSPTAGVPTDGIVVSVFGLGERSDAMPAATFSIGGETWTACTQSFEWTRPDGTMVGDLAPDLVACGGRAIEVPPGTSIAIETTSTTRVSTTRATTPFFEGDVGLVVTAEWPEGQATFIIPLIVAFTDPDLELVVLDCRPEDQVTISGPENRIEPAGSAYIIGNLPGFEQGDVVEQMTQEDGSDAGGLAGVWQVVREGSVVASVDYPDLSGVACDGTGIGGA